MERKDGLYCRVDGEAMRTMERDGQDVNTENTSAFGGRYECD